MRNFFIRLKNWLGKIWQSIRGLVSRIFTRPNTEGLHMSERLRPTVKYIASLAIIGVVVLGAIMLIKGNNDDESENGPEIAQIYEPSIGTPLPPDEPGLTPSPTPTPVAPKTGVDLKVAPKTGVDDNEPVSYKNVELKFAATLPAHTQVKEKANSVTFASTSGWYYTVTTSAQGSETLETIKAQLANSSSVKNLVATKFNDIAALQFTSSEFGGNGIAFIKDKTIYYLLGNQKYFSTFQLI